MTCDPNENTEFAVELKVNGNEIDLNEFVDKFLSGAVIGMISSLRGVDNIETVNIEISKK